MCQFSDIGVSEAPSLKLRCNVVIVDSGLHFDKAPTDSCVCVWGGGGVGCEGYVVHHLVFTGLHYYSGPLCFRCCALWWRSPRRAREISLKLLQTSRNTKSYYAPGTMFLLSTQNPVSTVQGIDTGVLWLIIY